MLPAGRNLVATKPHGDLAVLVAIASVEALIHIATNGRYGFHRDELQFLSNARHLDWGFVAYPPLTPLLERIALSLFGLSLVGLRLFSVLAQVVVVVFTGLMARELGAGRMAQSVAALSVVFTPLALFNGTEFQYTSFDYLWWVLIAYFTIRLLKSEDPRWWLAIGAATGLGLQTKYSIVFFIAGILGGVLFTSARHYVKTGWFWGGIALALLIFLPNILWLVHHDFISYRFLQHIHRRDVAEGRADSFLSDQALICMNVVAVPLALTGLVFYMRDKRYRMVGWMYLIPLLLFYFAKGRGYYVGAAYPMLLAGGSSGAERVLAFLSRLTRCTITAVFVTGLTACGAYVCALVLPVQNAGPLRDFALQHNSDLREEIGWNQLVSTVAAIRNSLPPGQLENVGVLVGNYGEAGAIEILGPAQHLPQPLSMTNSAWLRGYPTPPPSTLIVVGFSRSEVDDALTGCLLAGHNGNRQGIHNEESLRHPDIFVCGPPRLPWAIFWQQNQRFG